MFATAFCARYKFIDLVFESTLLLIGGTRPVIKGDARDDVVGVRRGRELRGLPRRDVEAAEGVEEIGAAGLSEPFLNVPGAIREDLLIAMLEIFVNLV